ncbi:hypothetical protein BaRGS_00033249 [Batillaria attramentaria]|uniref:Uncharacterized protein n=1 Tax=Batillaria attramentaria TaxID=370345 RepID=A0ABD0JKG5_9CAEN
MCHYRHSLGQTFRDTSGNQTGGQGDADCALPREFRRTVAAEITLLSLTFGGWGFGSLPSVVRPGIICDHSHLEG